MKAVGAVFPAEIGIGSEKSTASRSSVTRRRTVKLPGEYVYDGETSVESSYSPSPSRSQA